MFFLYVTFPQKIAHLKNHVHPILFSNYIVERFIADFPYL